MTNQTHKHLKPGQAQIIPVLNGGFDLRYMNEGSWLLGERDYGREADALQFCADRGLRVVS